MVDKAFEKLKERHGAPGEGCAFYILSFLLMALAANLLSFAIGIKPFLVQRGSFQEAVKCYD